MDILSFYSLDHNFQNNQTFKKEALTKVPSRTDYLTLEASYYVKIKALVLREKVIKEKKIKMKMSL